MAEEQLERSILERKERDELHAIASAMSLTPAPRSKKADIIDLILEATGVDVGGDGSEAVGNGARGTGSGTVANDETSATDDAARVAGSNREDQFPPEVAVADLPGSIPSAESTPGGELLLDASEPRPAPRFDEADDVASIPSSADGDLDDLRQRTNDRRPPRAAMSREVRQAGDGHIDTANRRSRRRRGRERGEVQPGQEVPWQGELVPVKGLLDLRDEGYGFLRTGGYLPSTRDVYVSVSQARRLALRRGDAIEGACRPAGPSEKYPALIRVDSVSGLSPDEARLRPHFEDLTPLFPDSQLRLELGSDPRNLTARIVDLLSPIGRGQRGMIVSPPKAGKTYVMKQIAHSIEANDPDVHLIVLLIAERPEEVTDMRRTVKGEVIASTFDRPADEHTAVAELTIERAKRLVELGRDVVILLDGITRLARAYNLAQPATGRIMSGGVDSGALYPPKRFFGAARNVEEGGSLTILATALVETGSKMDEVIFEEFKGTGNMELRLDRRLAERRIYPAIDVNASSTRHEELLFERNQLQQVWKLRRVLNALSSEGNSAAGLELLMDKIRTTASNDEFLAEIAKAPQPTA
ncbi:MAG TPA: transcription termination factor Rho [Acidimicrobiales bacterium]|nr:transcription termination factor Rho [Acidimicrobiales bacterium]